MTEHREIKHTDPNGYPYISVTNDENGVRIYTLKNGLTVYLAQNFDAPKINTFIPVRTGSNADPSDNTGLAHYLEHMMFKGTSRIGSRNWEKEQPLLEELSELFEQHKAEQDADKKKEIYRKIDEVSLEASRYAIANEYDKCVSAIGATDTNAHTSLDETVYMNNIPASELERWLMIERERFSGLTLRLFHTELETVYEEFNRSQDSLQHQIYHKMMELLFPTHPNGQQTTIGKAEHLKNPSMKAIHKYFSDYYVPNNMALVLVGDLDFDKTISLVDQYFGDLTFRELPERIKITEEPITEIKTAVLQSPSAPEMHLAWRTDSYGTREAILCDMVANLLTNSGEAGLLDMNLMNAQKVLDAQAYSTFFNEYGYISMVAIPKDNQTLDEVKDLLLAEIDNIKRGNFPEWMLTAIFNDFKTSRLRSLETANGLATNLYQNFIRRQTWQNELEELSVYKSITKEEIVAFANSFFGDNYVAIYKEEGTNTDLIRVENPKITPVELNRDAKSDFLKQLQAFETVEAEPVFVDYHKEIEFTEINGHRVAFVENKKNSLSRVQYLFPVGSDHIKTMGMAMQLMNFLGTERYSADELKQEFFKLGVRFDFLVMPQKLLIILNGLQENMNEGIALLHHVLGSIKADQKVYRDFVKTVRDRRMAAKRSKNSIRQALLSYCKFGPESRKHDIVTNEELEAADCSDFTELIKNLPGYRYDINIYSKDGELIKNAVKTHVGTPHRESPPVKIFPENPTDGKVYFVDYDMVQMEIVSAARAEYTDPQHFGRIKVFNEYFGIGLSSVVFQEIRESKSLAYSAFVDYQTSTLRTNHNYVTAYIGTQADKLDAAVTALNQLMTNIPKIEIQFNNAKNSELSKIASERITDSRILANYMRDRDLGVDYDLRKDIYDEIQNLTMEAFITSYNAEMAGLSFNSGIIGKRSKLDMAAIAKLGELYELSLEELFNY